MPNLWFYIAGTKDPSSARQGKQEAKYTLGSLSCINISTNFVYIFVLLYFLILDGELNCYY